MVIGLILVINLTRGAIDLWQVNERMKSSDEELKALENDKKALEKEFNQQLSADYAEIEIRDKLNMAKPGEKVVIIPEDKLASKAQEVKFLESQKTPKTEVLPVWRQWLKVLGF